MGVLVLIYRNVYCLRIVLVTLVFFRLVLKPDYSTSERWLKDYLLGCSNHLLLDLLLDCMIVLRVVVICCVILTNVVALPLRSFGFKYTCARLSVIFSYLLLLGWGDVEVSPPLVLSPKWPKSHSIASEIPLIAFI